LFALIASASAFVYFGRSYGPVERTTANKLTPAPLSTFSPQIVNLLTLGHRGLYEDLATIWVMQYLVDQDIKRMNSPERLYETILPVLQHQPKIESLYLLSCFVFSLEYNDPRRCELISVLGLKAFPESWRIPMTQGFVASFKLGDQAQAAVFYGLAATRPQSPAWVWSLARRLANTSGTSEVDLNEALDILKEVPGGTKLLQVVGPLLHDKLPAAANAPMDQQLEAQP